MLLDILKRLNWLDIFVIILLLRVIYVSIKNGLPVEIFKFLGTTAAIYVSLHYYSSLSDFVRQRVPLERMPLEFLDFLFFFVLAVVTYLIFVLLRSVFCRLMAMEAVPGLQRWGGLILGIARGFLLAGLIIFMLVISSISYLKMSVEHSYFSKRLLDVAPATYSRIWNSLASKFMTREKFNKTVLEVQEGVSR